MEGVVHGVVVETVLCLEYLYGTVIITWLCCGDRSASSVLALLL